MKGWLVLETGETYGGLLDDRRPSAQFVGRAGEVVFNTSHSGYEEIATDPSYFSQIMVMTAPMMGNYGADEKCWESNQVWIEGFIALEVQQSTRDSSWRERLAQHKVPILTEIDTRALVLRLRDRGTPWGAIVHAEDQKSAQSQAMTLIAKKKQLPPDWVKLVTREKVEIRRGDKAHGPRIAVMDYGVKENTLRELALKCSEVGIFPSRTSPEEIKAYNPQGILLSNGPGDPALVEVATETVRALLGWRPIFGICMGHQILGLAMGAKTYKLKFGHRGSNHPIRDELTQTIYVTSQNHGYAIDPQTLPADVRVTHTNINDNTVSGIENKKLKAFSVQFHPESHPGPHDARILFDYFLERLIQ